MPVLLALLIGAGAVAHASEPPKPAMPGFEIVRKHIDVAVQANAGYIEISNVAYKVLTEQGRDALRQFEFSYTANYQIMAIGKAYTQKPDGTQIPVARGAILYGQGSTSRPGFSDVRTITVVFSNVEVGDQVVIETYFKQNIPWFPNQFATSFNYSRLTVAHDVRVTLTAPDGFPLQIDVAGLEGGKREVAGGQIYWEWTFHNDVAQREEEGAVDEADEGPHLAIGSFPDFKAVAATYRAVMDGKANVTPEIQTLADTLTKDVSGRRAQARVLYDWVSQHIAYVSLVLGAGGFTPHEAGEVLAHKYGDCKDHVMLLEALLKAKGIDSSPVLIDTNNTYRLPSAASAFVFDHLITYIPEFKLFADSTAQFAPFGVLPTSDAGKPVILVASGEPATTPAVTANNYRMASIATVAYTADGSMKGHSAVRASGSASIGMRGTMSAIPPDGDDDYFRGFLGPGASGTLERGDVNALSEDYAYSGTYRVNDAAQFPGPAALTEALAYKPFFFTYMIGGDLPPSRSQSWVCPSLTAEETVTVELPKGTKIISVPKAGDFKAPEVRLQIGYVALSSSSLTQHVKLVLDHPGPVCSADYYNSIRPQLAKMIAALRKQIVYR